MTSPEDPTTPQTPPPRRLTRSSTDSMIGGVGGGLGRYFDIDPILFRIGFVVLALAGGTGLLAYAALWFLVPDEHGEGVRRPDGRNVAIAVGGLLALIILVGLLPGPGLFIWPGFLGLAALALLIALVIGGERGGPARSRLGQVLLIAAAIVLALVAGVSAAIGTAFGGGAVVAAIVIACGFGLIAGAFSPGRRWLLVPALVLAFPAAIVEAADLRVEGGVGEREYRPASVSELRDEYELGAGELVVDLGDVEFPGGRTVVNVDMGVGYAQVIVPADVCVSWDTEVGAGVAGVFDRENDGIDVDWDQTPRNEAGAPVLHVSARQDLGAFEIRRVGEPSTFDHDWEHDEDDRAPAQEACQ